MANNLSRAERNMSSKSQHQRLLEAHPWWEKVITLSRDLLDDSDLHHASIFNGHIASYREFSAQTLATRET